MQRLEKNEGDGWIDQGDGCHLVANDGSRSGSALGTAEGTPDEFAIDTLIEKGVAHVSVATDLESQELEFDGQDLRSGEETVVEVTSGSGTTYRVTFWGSPECDVRSEDEWATGGAGTD